MQDRIIRFLRIWDSPVFDDSVGDSDVAGTLTTHDNAYIIEEVVDEPEPKPIDYSNRGVRILGGIGGESRQRRMVYDTEQMCPALMAGMGMGGGIVPFIVEEQDGYTD